MDMYTRCSYFLHYSIRVNYCKFIFRCLVDCSSRFLYVDVSDNGFILPPYTIPGMISNPRKSIITLGLRPRAIMNILG